MKTEGLSMSFGQKTALDQSLRNTKTIFLDRANEQMKSYVEDLENSLAINKTIIEELVKKHVWSLQEKRVVEKLSQESTRLQEKVKNLVRERDALQTKLLITEQINANYKKREEEMLRDIGRAKLQYVSQISRKNYLYKILEKRHEQLLSILKIFAQNDQKIVQLLGLFKIDCKPNFNDSTGTNVTRENPLSPISKEREMVMNTDLFDQPKRERKQSMKLKTNPIMPVNEKDSLEKEANSLREKVLDLYRRNIKLSEALRVEKEKSSKSEDSASNLFAEGSLIRWNSVAKKTRLNFNALRVEANKLDDKAANEAERIKEENNVNLNSFSWGKPFPNKIV